VSGFAVGAIVFAACSTDDPSSGTAGTAAAESAPATTRPAAPASPGEGDASPPAAVAAIDRVLTGLEESRVDTVALDELAAAGDARHAWLVADLLRFLGGTDDGTRLLITFERLTGVALDDETRGGSAWTEATDHLIAWDTPGYPGYVGDKGRVYLLVEPRWEPFFADQSAAIDWRYVGWGGVLIDDRPPGDREPCPAGCIPALDDPAVTDAVGGAWYPDDAIVFGLVEGDDALAIPKNVAEVHELFNLTLGGRRFAVPYCTLCASAQAYRTDDPAFDAPLVLRTSGLLSRSNKVMYDLASQSVFDTFTGEAVSGPLHDRGVALEEVTVVRSTWGAWRSDHPDTAIVAEDGGVGRSYPDDPLGGRDDDGPIFPVGAVDDRLPAQELVVGVVASDGRAVAFPSASAAAAVAAGGAVERDGVSLRADGDGFRAVDTDSGAELTAHEAFWFAWSQFHPGTAVWAG